MYSYKILFDGIDIRTEYDNIDYRNSVIRAGAGPGSYRLCSKEKVRAYLNHRRANNCIRPCDMRLPGDGRQFRFNGLETILRELSRKLPLGETMIRIQKAELALDIALSNLNLQERFTEVATLALEHFPEFTETKRKYSPKLYLEVYPEKQPFRRVKRNPHRNWHGKVYAKAGPQGKNILRIEVHWSFGEGECGYIDPLCVTYLNRKQGKGKRLVDIKDNNRSAAYHLLEVLEEHFNKTLSVMKKLPNTLFEQL